MNTPGDRASNSGHERQGREPCHTSWSVLRRYTHLKPENVLEKLE